MNRKKLWIAYTSLLLAVFLWAGSFIAFKMAFQAYDPMVVVFGRMAVASMGFLFFINRFISFKCQRSDIKYIMLMAIFEPCLYFLLESKALQYTTASQAGTISSMMPLMVAIGASIFLKEQVSKQTYLGFLIAMAGVCWLSFSGDVTYDAPNPPLGNFLEFLAMGCGAGYTITLKKLTKQYPPFILTGIQAFCGMLFFMPFLFLPSTKLPTHFDATAVGAIVFLGVFVTMGAYGLYNYGVSIVSASQASAFCNLIPVCTIFLGWLILNESFSIYQYAAAIVIIIGVFMSQDWTQYRNQQKMVKLIPVPEVVAATKKVR